MPKPYLIPGLHAVRAVLRKHPQNIIALYFSRHKQDAKIQALQKEASAYGLPMKPLETLSEKIVASLKHQGVLALVKPPAGQKSPDLMAWLALQNPPLCLMILDRVQDPHNLGAIFRTSEALGADALIVPQSQSVQLTPTVHKVATGASEILPFFSVVNLSRTLVALKEAGVWLIGASEKATQSLYEVDLTGSIAWVLGQEESGLRQLTQSHCDMTVKIPLSGEIESLNVSVAAGICLAETFRQRQC